MKNKQFRDGPLSVPDRILYIYIYIYTIHMYSGITSGRVLNIYTCKLYKLINLCWSTGCFVKLHFTPWDHIYIYIYICTSRSFYL